MTETKRREREAGACWQRVEVLLDRLSQTLDSLETLPQLIGPEFIVSIREQQAQLRRELNALRDAYPASAPAAPQMLDSIRQRADRLASATTREARFAYDRLRTVAADPSTGRAFKEGMGDIARGALRAGRELGNAVGSAVDRFRRRPEPPAGEGRDSTSG
jgi:predicted  nucleic acid-binding Zn-ribbon protein